MPVFNFARNTLREYWDVPAATEEEARAKLEASLEGLDEFRSGSRPTDEDECPLELIDVEDEPGDDLCAHCLDPRCDGCAPEDTPSLDTSFHDHEMDID